MALTQEQENAIIQAFEITGLAAKITAMQENFEKVFDLNSFNAIIANHDSIVVQTEFEDPGFKEASVLFNTAIEEVSKHANNKPDVDQFGKQTFTSQFPKLYNFFKAKCFIENEHILKQESRHYPATVIDTDTNTTNTFNNPKEYYAFEVASCKSEFEFPSSIDTDIEQYVLRTEGEIETLNYSITHSEL